MAPPEGLAPGREVIVLTLGRKRGVVVAQGRDGRVQVRVDRVSVWCRASDLDVPPAGGRKRPARSPRAPGPDGHPEEPPAAPGRIDLHGLTVDEAMARVLAELDGALLRGADRVEVVHGKGSGRIRSALHRVLADLPAVAGFRLDPRNPGVTWIYFR